MPEVPTELTSKGTANLVDSGRAETGPGRDESMCQGPGVGEKVACLRKWEKVAKAPGKQRARGSVTIVHTKELVFIQRIMGCQWKAKAGKCRHQFVWQSWLWVLNGEHTQGLGGKAKVDGWLECCGSCGGTNKGN